MAIFKQAHFNSPVFRKMVVFPKNNGLNPPFLLQTHPDTNMASSRRLFPKNPHFSGVFLPNPLSMRVFPQPKRVQRAVGYFTRLDFLARPATAIKTMGLDGL
jgi:hypothetical protein